MAQSTVEDSRIINEAPTCQRDSCTALFSLFLKEKNNEADTKTFFTNEPYKLQVYMEVVDKRITGTRGTLDQLVTGTQSGKRDKPGDKVDFAVISQVPQPEIKPVDIGSPAIPDEILPLNAPAPDDGAPQPIVPVAAPPPPPTPPPPPPATPAPDAAAPDAAAPDTPAPAVPPPPASEPLKKTVSINDQATAVTYDPNTPRSPTGQLLIDGEVCCPLVIDEPEPEAIPEPPRPVVVCCADLINVNKKIQELQKLCKFLCYESDKMNQLFNDLGFNSMQLTPMPDDTKEGYRKEMEARLDERIKALQDLQKYMTATDM